MTKDVRDFWRIMATTAALVAAMLAVAHLCGGCVYRGGKVVDGTNLCIGMTIPGTEWTINALDFVGGIRVAGAERTSIVVTNAVTESNSYFGAVTTQRASTMTAVICPLTDDQPPATAK